MNDSQQTDAGVSRGEEEPTLSPPASGFGSEPAGFGPTSGRGTVANLNRSGRKPGTPNRITKTFKEAAERAFEEGGGVEWLVRMMNGTASDRAAVMGLFGRLIPAQLQAQVDTTVRVELNWLGGRGIGRVTDADVKALEAPQMLAANVAQQAVEDGVLVDAVRQQGGEG